MEEDKWKVVKSLKGSGKQSRFGTSLLSLGNLDDDKFEDFAVGAPGEDDGQGAIYIYYGDSEFNLGMCDERINHV